MRRILTILFIFTMATVFVSAQKLKVVTPQFKATGDIPNDEVVVITDYFITELASAMSGKAEVIDRTASEGLLEEQSNQKDDYSSSDGRQEVKIANATHVIRGQLQKFRNEIIVTIKITDWNGIVLPGTYTDRIKDVSDLFDKMTNICKSLASKINGSEEKIDESKSTSLDAKSKKSTELQNAEKSTSVAKKTTPTQEKKEIRYERVKVDDGWGSGKFYYFIFGGLIPTSAGVPLLIIGSIDVSEGMLLTGLVLTSIGVTDMILALLLDNEYHYENRQVSKFDNGNVLQNFNIALMPNALSISYKFHI